MKIKFKKLENGDYMTGIYRGKGGISSLVISAQGQLWHCLKIFTIRNIWRGLTW